MDPISIIQTSISIISTIQAQAEQSSSNIKTCKLLAQRCHDLIPSLNSMKANANKENYRASLQTLVQVLKDSESFITSHGKRAELKQFFNANRIRDEFKLLNDRLNTSIMNLHLGLQINDSRQGQEASDVLAADLNEIKTTMSEIAAVHNFRLDQISSNSERQNEMMFAFMQNVLDNVTMLRKAVDSSQSTSSHTSSRESESAASSAPEIKFTQVDESKLKKGELIGTGSYGDVYKCTYGSQEFALKLFEKSFTRSGLNSTEVKQITREVQILKLCHHTNIIGFVAATVSPEKAMIITELATCSLSAVNLQDSPIAAPFPAKVCWLADVLRGLRYLHFHGIIHRDLKPANILLVHTESADGRELIVAKIADFGVSSAVGLTTRRTGAKVEQVGTCAYDAPEVCDDVQYSASSDVYAWGITANELMTAFTPWKDARNDGHIVRLVGQGKRPKLFDPSTEAERELMRLVGSGTSGSLAQEPSERFTVDNLYKGLSALSTSLVDRGSPEVAAREMVRAPECPVCLSEYTHDSKCYLICSNGHSLCEPCKGSSTREGKCPVCRGPCLAEGGFVNRAVMDVVDAIALLNGAPASACSPMSDSSPLNASSPSVPSLSPKTYCDPPPTKPPRVAPTNQVCLMCASVLYVFYIYTEISYALTAL